MVVSSACVRLRVPTTNAEHAADFDDRECAFVDVVVNGPASDADINSELCGRDVLPTIGGQIGDGWNGAHADYAVLMVVRVP